MDVPEFGGIGDGLGDGKDAKEGIVLLDIRSDISHVKVGRAIKSDLHSRKNGLVLWVDLEKVIMR